MAELSIGLGEAPREPIKLGSAGEPGATAWALRPTGYVAIAVAVLWLFVSGVHDVVSGGIVIPLFVMPPLTAVIAADERRTAFVAGVTVVLTIAAGTWHGHIQDPGYRIGLAAACGVSVLVVVLAGARRRRQARLAQYDRSRAGVPARAAAPGDHRDQRRGPLPLGDTRSLCRRGSV